MTPRRFLFATLPVPGHLLPALAVAAALRQRGHAAALYTGASARALVEGQGLRLLPFRRLREERLEALLGRAGAAAADPTGALAALAELQLATLPAQLADLGDALAAWPADVVVSDPTLLGPWCLLDELAGLPVAVLSPFATWPAGADALPPPGRAGADGPARQAARAAASGIAALADAGWCAAVNALRLRFGLAPLAPPLLAHLAGKPLCLVPSTPDFDGPRRDLPPSVRHVGPCAWPGATPWDATPALPRGVDPLVVVSEGALLPAAPALLRAAVQALAGLPFRVLVAAGRRTDRARLGLAAGAANVCIVPWMPLREALQQAVCVVTSGGSDTVLASLAAGVPLVVAPGSGDQPANAARVEHAGAGVVLDDAVSPGRLAAAVHRVTANPRFRDAAERVAQDFARHDGAAAAAELLVALAAASAAGGDRGRRYQEDAGEAPSLAGSPRR